MNELTLLLSRIEAPALQIFLKAIFDQGLTISEASAKCVRDELGSGMTEDIAVLLEALNSGKLVPTKLYPSSDIEKKRKLVHLVRTRKVEEALKFKEVVH